MNPLKPSAFCSPFDGKSDIKSDKNDYQYSVWSYHMVMVTTFLVNFNFITSTILRNLIVLSRCLQWNEHPQTLPSRLPTSAAEIYVITGC